MIRDAPAAAGVPLLKLEGHCVDQNDGAGAQNRTRLEAMIEMKRAGERVLVTPSSRRER